MTNPSQIRDALHRLGLFDLYQVDTQPFSVTRVQNSIVSSQLTCSIIFDNASCKNKSSCHKKSRDNNSNRIKTCRDCNSCSSTSSSNSSCCRTAPPQTLQNSDPCDVTGNGQDSEEPRSWRCFVKCGELCENSPQDRTGTKSELKHSNDWTQQHQLVVAGKYEGGYDIWESSWDLVNHIMSCSLDFSDKAVLELGLEKYDMFISIYMSALSLTVYTYRRIHIQTHTHTDTHR
eukprot:GHVQ01008307.1.p1 GENE.GHVQ01008307.1~~GHVQ01008307.1.p1  ORF type:complete len:232 (+),score=43.15 GHVQ01008307.1:170-865(+)